MVVQDSSRSPKAAHSLKKINSEGAGFCGTNLSEHGRPALPLVTQKATKGEQGLLSASSDVVVLVVGGKSLLSLGVRLSVCLSVSLRSKEEGEVGLECRGRKWRKKETLTDGASPVTWVDGHLWRGRLLPKPSGWSGHSG